MQFFGGSEISPSPPAPTVSGNNAHMMYVFNRNGVCLLYREWNRPLHTLNAQQDHKLMFGLLFSLKSLTAKMDPTSAEKGNLGVPQLPGQGCSFHSFRTNTYKLSFMESPSGIKIILVTHPRTGDLRDSLKYIYNLYVEYVVKNPLYTPGTPIRFYGFLSQSVDVLVYRFYVYVVYRFYVYVASSINFADPSSFGDRSSTSTSTLHGSFDLALQLGHIEVDDKVFCLLSFFVSSIRF
ncbi:hypothetical protein TEA_016092 [Camellia sinensis var. sinensis]|uniref:Trafficking protein particle complex subunit n=1 Tax=Camellia sinensis var. sinensis TaxID=542762 RepID=A0A4S4DFW1_CAMSN|nr:hypothetical protein TEA_016092 [Camellia sinensis var. sinensis]